MENITKTNRKQKQCSNTLRKGIEPHNTPDNHTVNKTIPDKMAMAKQNISPPLTTTTVTQIQNQPPTSFKSTADIFNDDDSDKNDVLNDKVSDRMKI